MVNDTTLAITLMNRHIDQSANVRILALTTSDQAHGQVLTGADLRATNRVEQPSWVVPTALAVHWDGRETWRVELPRHRLASVVLRP